MAGQLPQDTCFGASKVWRALSIQFIGPYVKLERLKLPD